MEKLTQQEQVRRQKMQDLIDMGIDPFGSRYDRTSNSGIIKSSYEDKTNAKARDTKKDSPPEREWTLRTSPIISRSTICKASVSGIRCNS